MSADMTASDIRFGGSSGAGAPTGRPKVIIIGAGIGGLATGCYAQMSGADTQIFEKHVLPGGCCTAWSRDGYLFDYTIEWLIGTAPGNDANQVWRELGALEGKTIRNFEMFNQVIGEDGRSVTFYNDPDRLERHLLAHSPADAPLIRSFCRDLRRFIGIDLYPFLTPPPLRSVRERLRTLRKVLPAFRLFWRTGATQMTDYANKFSDPLLRQALPNIFFQDPECFPVLPFLYNMASAYNLNAGFPQGGSLGLARSVEQRYTELGGNISYRSAVTKILVENGRAVGVELKNGTRHYADYVVSACDGYATIYQMLDGRYVDDTIETLYQELLHRPGVLYPGVVSVFVGFRGDLPADAPHSATYLLSEQTTAQLPGAAQPSLVVQLRSRYSDGFAPPGCSLIHCTYFSDFDHWQQLRATDRKAYRAEKARVDAFVRAHLERVYPGINDRIEIISIATPATTRRYTGNYNGSILSWRSFTDAEPLVDKLVGKGKMGLPGLSRFAMAGQWAAGGGLIRAAASGRFVAQYLCRELGLTFRAMEGPTRPPWHQDQLGNLPQLDLPERRARRRGGDDEFSGLTRTTGRAGSG